MEKDPDWKYNAGLALVGPLISLPSSIHRKTAAQAWNWYQKWLSKMQEMEHEFP